MDTNDKDSVNEQNEKTLKTLKENWKQIVSGHKQVLTEGAIKTVSKVKTAKELGKDGKARGEALKSERGVTPMEEQDTEETKAAEVSEVPPVEAPPVVDAGAVVPPVEGGEEMAPVGLQANPEKQLATQQFVQAVLKGVQSGEANNKDLVTEYGFFKADVNDPANGQFVVIAYPADMKLKDIADCVEPVETPAEAGAEAGAEETGEVPPVEAPPVEAPPVEAGGEAPVEEVKENAEQLAESTRDPISVGKKNWKAYVANILNESANAKKEAQKVADAKKEEPKKVEELKEDEDKHLAQLEKELKAAEEAKDEKECAELKKEIAAHKDKKVSETGKKNAGEVAKKVAEKDKEDVKKLFGKGDKEDKEEKKEAAE